MSSLGIKSILPGKAMRTAALAIAICLAGLAFTGCNNQLLTVSGINSPVVMKYTVSNPLTIQEHKEGSGNEFAYSYITVSGLKDKEAEQAINDRIKAVYDELRIQDIPPYRGIKTKIPEGSVIREEQIYSEVTGNFNNILSVVLNKYTGYQDPNSKGYEKDPAYYNESKYFSEAETLNFDLNTGEEIGLKDLFCDNANYMSLVNDYMTKFLSKNYADDEGFYVGTYGEIKQVESFKGLSEDQKFALYPYGIAFVFDYRTPQFETGNIAVCPPVYFSEFGDNIAVTARFFNEQENIFTSQEPLVKSFLMKGNKNDIVGNDYYQDGYVNIYQTWSYSSKLPKEIRNKLDKMREVDKAKVSEVKQFFSNMTEAEISQFGAGAYEIMVFGNRMGNYINTSKYSNIYLPQSGEQVVECHCYDGGTLKELKLADIFIEGYNYKPVVMEAIRKAIKNYDGNYEGATGEQYSDQQYEDVYSQITGFNLAADTVEIPIIHPVKGNQTYGLSAYIPFKDFGCDNMIIFQ